MTGLLQLCRWGVASSGGTGREMRAPGLGNGGGSMAPGLLAASLDRWRDCPPGRGRWENRLGQGKTGLGSEFCREIRRQVMRRWPEERGGLPPLKTHSGASTVVGQVKFRSSGVERRALAARAAIPPLGRGSRAWGPPGGHQGGQGRKGSPPALRRGGVTQDVPLPVVGEQGFPLVQVNVGPPGPQPDGWDSGAPPGGALWGCCAGVWASLCLLSRFGEHAPPCPLTVALLFQNTLHLATDMPSWNSESKHSGCHMYSKSRD